MDDGQEGHPFLPFDSRVTLYSRMDESIPTTEAPNPEAPPIPSEPAPPINSRFLFVDVAALRAKQLRRGARPRLGQEMPQGFHKAERVAMEEVRNGLVYYNIAQSTPSAPTHD
jgi:DNA-directed RNA polymerase subunit K/omega